MQAVAQQATQQSISSLQQSLQHGAGMQHHSGLQHSGLPAASMHHGMNDIMTTDATAQVLPTHENNSNDYESDQNPHFYSEMEGNIEEMPESPSYMQGGYQEQDPYRYGETSASASNSGEDDDERDYDGKRSGGPMNGLSSKKRRKQSKPIRLGSEEGGEVEQTDIQEEGEVRFRRASGDSMDEGSPPSQGDAPLNLSAVPKQGDEKSEMGGLRVLGRELMQNPNKLQEGNRIPSEESSQMFPGGQFGMQHFMFPFSGMGPNTPSDSVSMSRAEAEQGFTPTSSSGRIQIFNIEAYCKLCNKEFCNKYFLKTHMANKHGIYSDPPTTTAGSGGPRFEGGTMPSSLSIGPPPSSMYDKNMRFPPPSSLNVCLPNTPVSISGSFMAMSSMRPAMSYGEMKPRDCTPSPRMSLPPGLLPQNPLPPRESPSRGSDGSLSRPQSNNGLRSPLPSPMRPHSTGQIERATPSSLSPKSGPPPLIPGRPSSGMAGQPDDSIIDKESSSEDHKRFDREMMMPGMGNINNLPPGIRLPMVPSMNPFGGPMPFDNFFKMNPLSPMDAMRKEEEGGQMNTQRPIPNVPNVPNRPDGPVPKGSLTPDRLRQMGVINADAFCEFCCKEFCNKYFLRVHKLKKHGVCSPELPPEKVQKILQQMAKEAGKTGQPMPPLTLGTPSAVRPPNSLPDTPTSMSANFNGAMPMGGPLGSMGSMGPLRSMGPLGSPLNLIRPPTLPNFLNLPPLDPIPLNREDSRSSSSSDKPDEREEGRPVNLQFSPQSMMEPECELKIDESVPVIKSPLPEDPEEQLESSEDHEQKSFDRTPESGDPSKHEDASEGLANLQNMIMKLNNTKPKPAESTTICKICNKDMENKYFLHAHMMNEHGVLHVEDERRSPNQIPVSLPQYPADLSKLNEHSIFSGRNGGLTIPSPMISRPPPLTSLANGFPKLSEKPLDFPKSIFEQMQGLPRPSFLDQMKKDMGGAIDIPMSPMKRPSLDRDPNKKPASLSRSYCEICKKELCNKYFMKTHMMKMHGIMMDPGPPNGGISCEICKKEVSSRYFLKVHMANAHGLSEDGSPIPPHLRENGLMNMFPIGEFPPPPMGEFSRLLMQQGEKNMERLKELDRQKSQETNGQGHICSLCSNSFPDIIALQVHIIKNHGALPPSVGIDNMFNKSTDENRSDNEEENNCEREISEKDKDDIAEEDFEESKEEGEVSSINNMHNSPFPFPLDLGKLQQGGPDGDASKNVNEMLQRQLQFPGMVNPLLGLPGLNPGANPPNPQFQGLFNMFLSEMLKKVQKETPPQTPPASPPPQEPACMEETTS
eukprot:TRINITY_DN6884_c0_g1_i1.p1 TRINITY_DN6884_c0_g1~~TRINITY_DN6884_c0_g1_i1.p1  ORF type:complete len:1311 (-),score=300.50 TRINITY_DN6884_c0_g1_i1:2883-6815(-)